MGAISIYKKGQLKEKLLLPPTEAGKETIIEYELRNNLGTSVEIEEVVLTDDALTVESLTKEFTPTGEGSIILKYAPDKDRLTPLKTKIRFKELIG